MKQRTTSNTAYYLTPALISSIKEKHRLARLGGQWPIAYKERYKKYRNLLTTLIRNAKNDYHKNNFNVNYIPCCDTAGAFNNHFINIVDCFNDFRHYLNPSPMNSMYLFPCGVSEIKRYINSLKSKSAGYDEIIVALLKQTVNNISIPLTYVLTGNGEINLFGFTGI